MFYNVIREIFGKLDGCTETPQSHRTVKSVEWTIAWNGDLLNAMGTCSMQYGDFGINTWICTIDQEIFTLKIICVKNFCVVKFSWFRSIRKKFLTVDYCNMDEHLESSWRLVYYQVWGEPGIAHCSRRSNIYLVECGLARKLIHWSSPRHFIFHVFNFRSWSRLRNYFNSEIFLIYGIVLLSVPLVAVCVLWQVL